jgi:hypothetical protein
LVGFSEFVDGGDVIGWEWVVEVVREFHGSRVTAPKLEGRGALSRKDLELGSSADTDDELWRSW